MRPLISVITINLNNAKGLEKTINSVKKRKNNFFEYLVIDGGSTDDSHKVIEKYSEVIDRLIVETDQGVFDAFNKGLRHSRGEWVCMMNSGDELLHAEGLEEQLSCADDSVSVMVGRWLHNGEVKSPGAFSDLRLGKFPFCHQAMFIRRGHFYNSNYRVFGDLELLARFYKSSPSSLVAFELLLAEYEGGGISARRSLKKRVEKLMVVFSYFGVRAVLEVVKGFVRERFS